MLRMSLICVATCLLPIGGCASSGGGEGEGSQVVATTTHVADIAQNVAGDRVDVHSMLAANADPHDFEPRPSDVTAMAEADLVITSGGEVDEWVDELIESSGTDADVVSLLDSAPVTRTSEGETDPHWWQDPRNAVAATETIRDELADADPEGESEYAENESAYSREIEQADRAVAECMSSLPDGVRKLVTSHDALGYLADRYDIEVVGAAIPALSTQAQPSVGETAELIDLIEEEGVRAVFPETGLSGELEEAIAHEADVAVGEPLYADALGEARTPGDTYLGTIAWNASALIEGFSGGASGCEVPEAS